MSARDRYSFPITCPRCGKRGEAHWSEHERASIYTGTGRRLEAVPPGFVRGAKDDAEGYTEIICETCRVPARH